MQVNNSGKLMGLTMSGLLIAGFTVLLAQHGNAESDGQPGVGAESQRECSNRTLRGSYAFNVTGTILAGPNRLLLRAVAMTEFDGRGNLSQVDFATLDGVPTGTDWRPADGTYELNADCTGTMVIIPLIGPTLNLRMVVADHGRTIYNIVEGNATGATGTKVD